MALDIDKYSTYNRYENIQILSNLFGVDGKNE